MHEADILVAMRIGIDCRLWDETGVGRYIRNLVSNLFELDKENEYVLFCLGKDLKKIKDQILNIKNTNQRSKTIEANIRWHSLEEQVLFPSILNKENLDLVHFPYFSVPIFYNRPFVVTIHDLILHHFPTGESSTLPLPIYYAKLAGYKFIINRAAKKAKKIIAVSNSTKHEIIDHLAIESNKVEVIYEGVKESVKLKIKSKQSLGSDDPEKFQSKVKNYFLYVGNVYPHKNIDLLLKVFANSEQLAARSYLLFVGKEDYFYGRLREKIRSLNLQDKVLFKHDINDDDLTYLYQHATALIAPSLMEGFGLTPLEAIANDCLVIASDIPAHREILGDSVVYFDPYNVESLANAINQVLNNREKFDNLKKQSKLRLQKYSWEKMARETLKVYTSNS